MYAVLHLSKMLGIAVLVIKTKYLIVTNLM